MKRTAAAPSAILLLLLASFLVVNSSLTIDTNAAPHKWWTCYSNSTHYQVKEGQDTRDGTAWGYFDDGIETVGYGVLSIMTSPNFNDNAQMGCAGYLEGYITALRIRQMYHNYHGFFPSTNQSTWHSAFKFVDDTMRWTLSQVREHRKTKGPETDYWNHVGLIMTQLASMTDGYNAASDKKDHLAVAELFILNMAGDLDDLLPALERKAAKVQGKHKDFIIEESDIMNAILNSHCSSIVKPNNAKTELFAAQEMWSAYSQLMGIYKSYAFNLKAAGTKSQKVSFASYPGFLSSEDDFYITDANLVVMETTNSIFNLTLYDYVTLTSQSRHTLGVNLSSGLDVPEFQV